MTVDAAVWADNTTQDRMETDAQEHGWTLVESTAEKTVLYHNHRVLTVMFSTRERDGQIFTAITGWTLKAGHWSTSKGYQVANLIDRYGAVAKRNTPQREGAK